MIETKLEKSKETEEAETDKPLADEEMKQSKEQEMIEELKRISLDNEQLRKIIADL